MTTQRYKLIAIGLMCGTAIPVAHAQTVNQIVTPAQREQDLQISQGIRLGSFVVVPTVTADVTYDDNIFASDTNAESDVIGSVRPEVALRSQFANHALNASAFYSRNFYAKNGDQATSQYGVRADGLYTAQRDLKFTATASAQHSVESRRSLGSFRIASKPVEYDDIDGSIGTEMQTGGRLFVNMTARARRVTYGDTTLAGVPINQKFRNFTIFSGDVAAGYNLHELTRFIVDVGFEKRSYDLRPGDPGFDPLTNLDRSAKGFRIEAGIQRELTAVISGTLRIGYLNLDYADPTLIDISAFSYYGDLRWSLSPLTTVTVSAARRVDETVSPNSAGNLRDEVTIGVGHELLRNLFLQATTRYASIKPSGPFADSQEFGVDLSARYYFGDHFRLEGGYSHSSRASDNRSIAYRDNLFFLALRVTP